MRQREANYVPHSSDPRLFALGSKWSNFEQQRNTILTRGLRRPYTFRCGCMVEPARVSASEQHYARYLALAHVHRRRDQQGEHCGEKSSHHSHENAEAKAVLPGAFGPLDFRIARHGCSGQQHNPTFKATGSC